MSKKVTLGQVVGAADAISKLKMIPTTGAQTKIIRNVTRPYVEEIKEHEAIKRNFIIENGVEDGNGGAVIQKGTPGHINYVTFMESLNDVFLDFADTTESISVNEFVRKTNFFTISEVFTLSLIKIFKDDDGVELNDTVTIKLGEIQDNIGAIQVIKDIPLQGEMVIDLGRSFKGYIDALVKVAEDAKEKRSELEVDETLKSIDEVNSKLQAWYNTRLEEEVEIKTTIRDIEYLDEVDGITAAVSESLFTLGLFKEDLGDDEPTCPVESSKATEE